MIVKHMFRRLSEWYRDLSLSRKIYIPNFAIILLLVVVSVYVATGLASDMMIQRISETTNQSLDIIIQSLNGVLNSIEEAGAITANDEVIQSVLRKLQDASPGENTDHYFLVRTALQKVTYLKKVIDGITIYTSEGVRVGMGNISGSRPSSSPILDKTLVDTALENSGRNVWLDLYEHGFSGPTLGVVGLSMFRSIQYGDNGPVIGILQISVSGSIFSSLYSHLDYGRTGRFLVIDNSASIVFPEVRYEGPFSEVVSDSYLDWIGEHRTDEGIHHTPEGDLLVVSNRLDRLGWTILGIVPLNEQMQLGQRITLSIYLIGALFIALEIAFAILIARSISQPIVSLSQSMSDAASGDLSIRLQTSSKDEIGDLTRDFNNMLEQMSSLMDRVYIQHRRERELELMALQSQINPHFLYNSLESISALAQIERNEDAYNLAKALSLFYRGVLSNGRPVITIGEEVQTIRHYFIIQKMRYQEKLSYHIDVDAEILDQQIVKLSLQPLVENSIYHGLKASRRPGMIEIHGRRENTSIRLTVKDNGAGIAAEMIQDVINGNPKMKGFGGFGLSSVDQRLKQCFGAEFGISIESSYGKWTRVHVCVPYDGEKAPV